MTSLSKMVGFVTTSKPAEALAFYRDKLGFRLLNDDNFALVFDANGTMLRIAKSPVFTPQQGTVLGWEVADIGGTVEQLVAKGVVFNRYPGMPHDDHGIWTTPNGDRVAWFSDPDGNTLSVSQHGSLAK
jgi:catechol 2,3-dioxygenase-like lactoylglutathione lyase family enzyme